MGTERSIDVHVGTAACSSGWARARFWLNSATVQQRQRPRARAAPTAAWAQHRKVRTGRSTLVILQRKEPLLQSCSRCVTVATQQREQLLQACVRCSCRGRVNPLVAGPNRSVSASCQHQLGDVAEHRRIRRVGIHLSEEICRQIRR